MANNNENENVIPLVPDTSSQFVVNDETPVKEEVTPVETTEKVETKEEPEIDFNDFLRAKGDDVPEKKAPEKKNVEKKEEVVEEKEEKIETLPPDKTKTQKLQTEARDLTGIDEQDAPLFKKMHNDAFNKLKPVYLEYKKQQEVLKQKDAKIADLEKGIVKIPDNYYEHPNAVLLTPEFEQTANTVQKTREIAAHWRQQLINIRSGAKEFDLLLNDGKGGFVIQKAPADEKAEANVLDYFGWASDQARKWEGKLTGLTESHRAKVNDSIEWVKGFEQKAFAAFDKEENKGLQKIVDDTVNTLPAAFRTSPLARVLAKALITCNHLGTMLAKQQKTTAVAPGKEVKTAKALAGPTASETGAGEGKTENEPTFEDFKNVIKGY
jgi:hypothetical protein